VGALVSFGSPDRWARHDEGLEALTEVPFPLTLTEPPSLLMESALSYADKPLVCRDCGRSFSFTAGEQEFFASRGFTNEPSRCPECRADRKATRGSGGGYSSGGGYGREREMFSATCASCGNEARVPFQPRGDKPVYCSDCFSKQRGGYSSSYR
jgi:CxxC-x17-CxxC domain-containing protein